MLERMKGVKCLACRREDGGLAVAPSREDEGKEFDMQDMEKETEETVPPWGGGIVLLCRGRKQKSRSEKCSLNY